MDESTTEGQLKKLISVMEVQNTMLAQLLSFTSPIADFFRAVNLVMKPLMVVVAGLGLLWGAYQAVKEWIKLHP